MVMPVGRSTSANCRSADVEEDVSGDGFRSTVVSISVGLSPPAESQPTEEIKKGVRKDATISLCFKCFNATSSQYDKTHQVDPARSGNAWEYPFPITSNVLFSGPTDSRNGLANMNSLVFAHAVFTRPRSNFL